MKDDLIMFLEKVFSEIIQLTPRILLAGLVLILGYVIAKIAASLTKRFILYLNRNINDRLQHQLLKVDLGSSAKFISKTLFWIILVLSFLVCIHILKLNFLTEWLGGLVTYLPNVLAAVIIIFTGIISGRLLGDVISSAASSTGIANGKFLGNVVRYLILFVGIVIGVDQLGIDIAFLTNLVIVIIGALIFGASLAFGLGAKTSVGNILGSYYARKSFTVGSKIRIGEVEGVIVKIGDNSISVETKNGLEIIPAADFNSSKVTLSKEE